MTIVLAFAMLTAGRQMAIDGEGAVSVAGVVGSYPSIANAENRLKVSKIASFHHWDQGTQIFVKKHEFKRALRVIAQDAKRVPFHYTVVKGVDLKAIRREPGVRTFVYKLSAAEAALDKTLGQDPYQKAAADAGFKELTPRFPKGVTLTGLDMAVWEYCGPDGKMVPAYRVVIHMDGLGADRTASYAMPIYVWDGGKSVGWESMSPK